MGIFKEEVRALEDLQRRQSSMWNDSADYGVQATDEVKSTMRWVLKSLLALEESKVVWKMDDNGITQRQYELTVYFSMEDGVTFNVLYYKGPKREFFSIDAKRALAYSPVASNRDAAPGPLLKEYFNVSDEEMRVG